MVGRRAGRCSARARCRCGPRRRRRRGRAGPGGAPRSVVDRGPRGARPRRGSRSTAVGAGQPGRDRARAGTARPARRSARRIGWQDRRRRRCANELAGQAARARGAHRPAARPVLRRAEDDVAAANRTARRRGHDVDAWLIHRLTGGVRHGRVDRVADPAARPRPVEWSAEACALFGLDPGDAAGGRRLRRGRRGDGAFGGAVPVTGLAVDQQAALLAERLLRRGRGEVHVRDRRVPARQRRGDGPRSASRLAACVAWRLGRAADLLPRRAGLHRRRRRPVAGRDRRSRRGRRHRPPRRAAARRGGVVFVPSLAGLGAPFWAPEARGRP